MQGELRSVARQRAPFVLRTLYAGLLALGGATTASYLADMVKQGWSGESLARIGGDLFGTVVMMQALLAITLGALLGVASMHGERQNKTLGLLALSQLRSWEIIVGKFLAILGLVAMVLLAGLPAFALLGWMGGFDYSWLLWSLFYTLAFAAVGSATGLFFGLRFESLAVSSAASLGFLSTSIFILWAEVMGFFTQLGLMEWLLKLPASPLVGLYYVAVQNADPPSRVVEGMAVGVAACTLLIWCSTRILPRAVAAGPGRGLRGLFEGLDTFFERINLGGIRFNLGGRRGARGNPVTWLTETGSGLGLRRYGVRVLLAAMILALSGLALASGGSDGSWLIPFFWGLAACGVPLASGANAFGDEKSRGTFGVLLSTPLSAAVILRGKLYVFLRLLVFLALPALFLILAMERLMVSSAEPFWHLTRFLLGEAFLAYTLTLFLSLFVSTPVRAAVGGVAGVVAFHVLYRFSLGIHDLSIIEWLYLKILLWVFIVAAVVMGARWVRRGRLALGLFALLAALATILGQTRESFHEYRLEMDALMAGVLIFFYTIFVFDRAVGRTP